MARFVFKLQPVLNIKTQMEDSLKNELGKAIRSMEEEKRIQKQIEDEREECINENNQKSSNGITVEKLREYSVYISLLKEKIELQKENVKYAENIVDNYREKLIKVSQEKEMLEQLKEKKFKEFQIEEERQERRVTDEIISYNYNNRISGEENG